MTNDLFALQDRVAMVTGGNSGIGRAMALALRDAGAKVFIAARRADRNVEALAELGPTAAACELDVGNEVSVEKAMQFAVKRFGRLDILVNNAGTAHRASVM